MAKSRSGAQGSVGMTTYVACSIGDGEALADVLRVFELVDQGDGIVFGGDGAVSLLVGYERVAAEAEFAGALAGLDEDGGREVGPGKIGLAQDVEGVAVGNGDGFVFFGQVTGIDDIDAGGDVEAAGSADEDETPDIGLVKAGDEGARGFEELLDRAFAGAVGADDGVGSLDFAGYVVGVEDISLHCFNGGMGGDFGGVASDGGDGVSAGDELVEDAAADHSGGAVEDDVHGGSLMCSGIR
jgi:hypothetical protein